MACRLFREDSASAELLLPIGTRLATPTTAELRCWFDCCRAVLQHGLTIPRCVGPFWFRQDDPTADDGRLRGFVRPWPGGFAIYIRCGLGSELRSVIFHELGHATDRLWDADPDEKRRENRANAFAERAMRWR